ncbi:carotenoid oxygenase family protein [Phormidium sp. FACHB-592]|uniref:Carotenoid oxygenase family protein n=1 Tax=Stenomitos frigidus AS-A4 TaxID=2933935 RepID=A0ABV0KT10_9CYAN|nr:carotenoid oxygenase family protein [Phormidium sp. FACHB-592]MBD2073319.1 carotenoid oxygenase family protein [Phormidium sp. FACHB-592]
MLSTMSSAQLGVELAFTSLNSEVEIDDLPIEGNIPRWLKGSLFRNGPAKFETGQASYNHWFDGLAMVHRYSFRDGQIAYRNRFLRTSPYTQMMSTGQLSSGFETVQPTSLGKRILKMSLEMLGQKTGQTYNTNVNVICLADQFMALTEQPVPTVFDPITLETRGAFYFDDTLFGHLSCGHPQYDDQQQEYINYVTCFGPINTYNLYRVKATSRQRSLIARIPVRSPCYMHSFAATENFIILVEFPLVVKSLPAIFGGKAPMQCLSWEPRRGTNFRVIHKHSGDQVARFQSEACFAFHHINAYEEGNEIVVDLAASDQPDLMYKSYLKPLKSATRSKDHPLAEYRRYRLPLQKPSCKAEVGYELLSEQLIEMVCINQGRCRSRDYRYAYAVSHNRNWPTLVGQLVKIDVKNCSDQAWFEPNTYPGEPLFVAAPNGTAEDDGVILSVVLDAAKERSFLLVLHAQSFKELGRAYLPHHVPLEFHGLFVEEI